MNVYSYKPIGEKEEIDLMIYNKEEFSKLTDSQKLEYFYGPDGSNKVKEIFESESEFSESEHDGWPHMGLISSVFYQHYPEIFNEVAEEIKLIEEIGEPGEYLYSAYDLFYSRSLELTNFDLLFVNAFYSSDWQLINKCLRRVLQ